eukprot:6614368-Prymnesium_polylepis.1
MGRSSVARRRWPVGSHSVTVYRILTPTATPTARPRLPTGLALDPWPCAWTGTDGMIHARRAPAGGWIGYFLGYFTSWSRATGAAV